MDKDLLKSKIKRIKELTYTDIALEMLENEELIVKMLEMLQYLVDNEEINYEAKDMVVKLIKEAKEI